MTIAESLADMRKQIEEARRKFKERSETTHGQLVNAVTKSCLLIERTAKQAMQDTETNEAVTYGKRGHHPSVPFDAPAIDNGTLVRSITHDVESSEGKVSGRVGSTITNPPYGAYLENGTANITPRPWLMPAIRMNREKIQQIIGEPVKGRVVSVESE